MLEFVSCFDELVYFFVLCVYLFFHVALCGDECLIGFGEVRTAVGGPCDESSYEDAAYADCCGDYFGHGFHFTLGDGVCSVLYNWIMIQRETVENVLLIVLSVFLIAVMAVAGFMIVVGLPAFARFLFIVWYVLIV